MLTGNDVPLQRSGLGHRVRIELSARLLNEGHTRHFPPELEEEFLSFSGERVLSLLRLALGLAPLLYLVLFLIDALLTQRLQTPIGITGLLLGAGSSFALFAVSTMPARRAATRALSPWCNLFNGLAIVMICADATRRGWTFHYEMLALVFAYTFFLGGLRPRESWLVAGAITVTYGVSQWLAGQPGERLAVELYFLVTLAGLGTLGAVMMDRSQRRFWLQRVLTTELSISDSLTGLHNHRYLKEQGDALLRHAARELRPVALLLIDVDSFKSYNDSQGHLAGDECLRRLGLMIEATGRRPLDIAARYGGEEFAVLMYDCVEPQARRRAQELCDEVARMRMPHPAAALGHVSVSIGLAAGIPPLTGELETFTRMADAALYSAKARGRNCVESSSLGP